MIHFVCEENKSNDNGRFLRFRSSGQFDEYIESSFSDKRFCDFPVMVDIFHQIVMLFHQILIDHLDYFHLNMMMMNVIMVKLED